MTKTIENLFYYSALGSDLLIIFFIILFLITHKRKNSLIIILAYCVINLLLNYFLSYVPHEYIIYAYASFTFIEYLLFSLIFYLNIKNSKFKNLIILFSIFFGFLLLIYYLFQIQKIDLNS
jgi:hypothetical protein